MCSYIINLSNNNIVAVMTIAEAAAAPDDMQFQVQRILMRLG
jgi:hypothetical protein